MTAEKGAHPSAFDLDVYFAQGQPSRDPCHSHLAGCPPCRGYVDALEAASRETAKARSEEEPQDQWIKPRWLSAGAGLIAVAALVVGFRASQRRPQSGDDEPPDYVGAKGTPAVQIVVRRGAGTAIWDGRSPVKPRDALAFRVACEGFDQVAVMARPDTHSEVVRMYEGPCPAMAAVLPFSLTVDAQPGDESVALILSRQPLDDRAALSAVAAKTRNQDLWVIALSLPKGGGH